MEIEEKARTLGWVPQDQFKGDPAKWVSPEEFVERGESIMPILKKNNERLVNEVETLKIKNAEVMNLLKEGQEAMAEFRQYHEQTKKRAYEQAIVELEARKVTALENGAHREVVEIDSALRKLENEPPVPAAKAPAPAPQPQGQGNDPVFVAWEQENSSWLSDANNLKEAQGQAAYLRAIGTPLTGRAFLDAVKEAVEKKVGGQPTSKVEGGSNQSRSSRQTYADLPADVKEICDRQGRRLVGEGKAFKTTDEWRKQYVKDYFS